jgi:ATP-dependent Clp protease ATP-binding subunit ClpB
VFNVLLQMLDDGRVTDSQGRVVSFRNSIVILTSNIGSSFILEEETPGAARERVMAAVRLCYVMRADCCSLALEADASCLP